VHIHYVNCFSPRDNSENELRAVLDRWSPKDGIHLTEATMGTPEDLRDHLIVLNKEALDVLLIGGHGHKSLRGFLVRDDPVRWQDLAFLLRGTLSETCSFIFYSCNGGYPGLSHMFGRESGPDFVFGPYIRVNADAMAHAVQEILAWKLNGGGDVMSARSLVDTVNEWARATYFSSYDQKFLRVTWSERPGCRHPNEPGLDKPSGPDIKLRCWGLEI